MPKTSVAVPLLLAVLAAPAILVAAPAWGADKFAKDSADAAPLTECDTLAQPPRTAMGRVPALTDGVTREELRWPGARAACTKAMADYPGEVRFVAYAGRAADKGGDSREAARLYRAAADEGNALAQNNLGVLYSQGAGGLARDLRQSEHYYRLAAEQGYPAAQTNLGAFYAQGQGGLRRDDREAVRWWQMAAEAGDTGAQNNLAAMYATGRGGLPRDMEQAVRMWRMAAEAGNAEARNNLRKAGRL